MHERTHLRGLFQGFLIFSFAILFIYFSARHIAHGNVRIPVFFLLSFMAAAISTSVKWGTYFAFTYIVFMAFIKRFLFAFVGYAPYDPVYLIPDIVVIVMFLVVWSKYKKRIIEAWKKSFAFKVLFFLQIIFFLEIFNPLQGNLIVGIVGSKFLLIPSLWAYISFGIDRKILKTLFKILTWLGVIAALYTIYQFHKGFFDFEILWAKNSGMTSLVIGGKLRPFSFFPSPGELSGYLSTNGLIETALAGMSFGVIITIFKLVTYAIASFYTNIRAGPFVFLFLFPLLLAFKLTKRITPTILTYYFILFGIFTFISNTSLTSIKIKGKGYQKVYVEHFLQGFVDPTAKGSSFIHRLKIWRNAMFDVLKNPIGNGIGVSTLAANKFGGKPMHVESTFISMIYSCGIFGFLSLMILTLYTLIKGFIRLSYKRDKILLAIWIGYTSIVMGQWIVTYFQGAFYWLSLGLLLRWIDLEEEI